MSQDLIHHNIMHDNDIKLVSLIGNIRLNTSDENKIYLNSNNNTLTINENSALGFGKDTINYGSVGDVLMSNGSAGSMWSSTFNDDIMGLNNYVQELQSFFNNFQQCLFLSDASGSEVDYNILVNGPAKSLSASSVLENEIIELKSYMNQVKLFFSQFKESIYISDSSGVEINYNNLLKKYFLFVLYIKKCPVLLTLKMSIQLLV